MADHPDFASPWCQTLLLDPNIQWIHDVAKDPAVTNNMFNATLHTSRAIRAHLSLQRRCSEPDAVLQTEYCMLLSIGDGVDGKAGRAHGGFNALILDQVTGYCAFYTLAPKANPPATATLTVDYKAPVDTPGVVLARAWVTETTGRKIWLRAVIEDCDGKVLASGKALFINPRPSAL